MPVSTGKHRHQATIAIDVRLKLDDKRDAYAAVIWPEPFERWTHDTIFAIAARVASLYSGDGPFYVWGLSFATGRGLEFRVSDRASGGGYPWIEVRVPEFPHDAALHFATWSDLDRPDDFPRTSVEPKRGPRLRPALVGRNSFPDLADLNQGWERDSAAFGAAQARADRFASKALRASLAAYAKGKTKRRAASARKVSRRR